MTQKLNIQSEATPPTTDWLAATTTEPNRNTDFGEVTPNPFSVTPEVAEAPATPGVDLPKFNDPIDAMADPTRPTPEATDIAIGPGVFYPGTKSEAPLEAAPEEPVTPTEAILETASQPVIPEVTVETEPAVTTESEVASADVEPTPVTTLEMEEATPETSTNNVQETLNKVNSLFDQADQLRGSIRESLATLAEQKAAETERHEQALATENEEHEQKIKDITDLEKEFRKAETRIEEKFEKRA